MLQSSKPADRESQTTDACQSRIWPQIWSARGTQEHFVLQPTPTAFSSVSRTGDKFVFRQENLLLYLGFSILLKAECESQCIVRCVGKDSSEGWRDRLDGGVREPNAEIQPGGYFCRFDRPDDIDRADIYRVVGFFKNSVFVPSLNTLFRVG